MQHFLFLVETTMAPFPPMSNTLSVKVIGSFCERIERVLFTLSVNSNSNNTIINSNRKVIGGESTIQ